MYPEIYGGTPREGELPSNYNSSVTSENLRKEMLGKYVYVPTETVKRTSSQRKAEVSRYIAVKPQNENDFGIKTQVNRIKKVNSPVSSLVENLGQLLSSSNAMVKPLIRFDISKDAAMHNYSLLKKNGYSLAELIRSDQGTSVTTPGSEFKPVTALKKLLGKHPRWNYLEKLIRVGSEWIMEPIEEQVRLLDLKGAMKRGNHKSASKHEKFLADGLKKEIRKGWQLILPLVCANEIPNLVISPMGVAEALGISARGKFVPKKRITHDLSFLGCKSQESTNSRILDESLEPCMFGYCLLRLIHKILQLRRKYPSDTIWIRKEDIKSAYRRIHMHPKSAFKVGVQAKLDGVSYLIISLRLPFGGKPCSSEFCILSDIIADTINDVMVDKSWDPMKIHSKFVSKIPRPQKLASSIPFAKAEEVSVPLHEEDECKADVFIEDIISVVVDQNDNLQRIIAAPCSVMHAIAHSSSNEIGLPRDDFIADDKNDAEGAAEEEKICLGLTLNTRSLTISLPSHKFKAWSAQVEAVLRQQRVSLESLRSILGRMENVAIIIPMFGHFLSNVRQLEIKAALSNKNQQVNKRCKDDLQLFLSFLQRAHTGVNMNLISFRVPNKIYINDACEHGLGGYSKDGKAWSWVIPEHLRGRAHINFLEFIAQVISIWLDIEHNEIQELDCILAMGDNSASMGWLRRTNFRENEESDTEWSAKQQVARKLASLVLDSNSCLYRQWFKGTDNLVADSLSRDTLFLLPNSHHSMLKLYATEQIPENFKIVQLPNKISSFVTSILQLLPVKQQRLIVPKPSDLLLSRIGNHSLSASELGLRSSTIFQDFRSKSSCQLLHKPLEKPLSLQQITSIWWREQSMPPSHMWLRPSGQTTGQTQDWTSMERSALCFKNSSEDIAIKMDPDISKRHYRCRY